MNTRNFQFRVSPRNGERGSRFVLDTESDPLPQGVPVVATGEFDATGRAIVELATNGSGNLDKPKAGQGGILVYEQFRYDGTDTTIATYSDMDTVPAGRGVQVVTGENRVKVAYKTTDADSFYNRADYPTARVMVAGAGATPTVAVGDYLTPSTGTDVAGYWEETSDAAEAWLVVTSVDSNGWVEAVLNF
jgi:hypothetical protein